MKNQDKYAVVLRHYDESSDGDSYKIIGYATNEDDAATMALATSGYVGDIISVVDINCVSDIENNDIFTCIIGKKGNAISAGSAPRTWSLNAHKFKTWQNSWETSDVSVFKMINTADIVYLPVSKLVSAGAHMISYAMESGKSYGAIDNFIEKAMSLDETIKHNELSDCLLGVRRSELAIYEIDPVIGKASVKLLYCSLHSDVTAAANNLRDVADVISEGKGCSFLLELAAVFRAVVPLRDLLLCYVDNR